MKQFLSILTLIITISYQSQAQEVPEIQRPLITKIAATWCPPCGGWSWDLYHDMIEDNEDNAVLITAHHSGDLVNPVAQDFSENLEAPYQPYIYFNNEDQNATSSNTASVRTAVQDKVTAASQESPVANAGMDLVLNGDELQVQTKTKFFQDADGEYYLGVYIIEDLVINFQANQGPNAVHEKILRDAVSSGSFGELLENGSITAGTEFDHSFTKTLDANWKKEDLEIVAVIWKKENDLFQVVNSNISTDIKSPSATADFTIKHANIGIQPTIVRSSSVLSIESTADMENTTLNILDTKGTIVARIYQGSISSGTSEFILDRQLIPVAGTYFISLQHKNKILTRPFVVK